MSNIEKEIRLKISNDDIKRIKEITTPKTKRIRLIDITCGKYGFDSLKKLGYICRIRCKDNSYKIEIKKYLNNNKCEEKSLKIDNIKDALEFLSLLDMTPYLILDRYREVRTYQNLDIFIDEFKDIGPYLEIEYQNSTFKEAISFAKNLNLDIKLEEKYGDIVKKKLETSKHFKNDFEKQLKETINNV